MNNRTTMYLPQQKTNSVRRRYREKIQTISFCIRWPQHKICNRQNRLRQPKREELRKSAQNIPPISCTSPISSVLSLKLRICTSIMSCRQLWKKSRSSNSLNWPKKQEISQKRKKGRKNKKIWKNWKRLLWVLTINFLPKLNELW